MLKNISLFCTLSFLSAALNAESVSSSDGLSAHNAVRTNANQGQYAGQPVPNPLLKEMSWDDSLAESAQQYANQCVWEHSSNRINTGDNLYVEGSSNENLVTPISQAVESWAAEYAFYDFSSTSCQDGEMCGHYTQIVWQESLLVGCAVSRCTPILDSNGDALFSSNIPYSNFYVCQYRQAGNLTGLAPYDTDGGDASLYSSYELSTETLDIPYILVHYPDNLVAAYSATLKLIAKDPYTFNLQTANQISYLGKRHSDSYDTNISQLYLPNLQLTRDGSLQSTYAAVLKFSSESDGFELKTLK